MRLRQSIPIGLFCALLGGDVLAQQGGITTGGGSRRPITVRGTVTLADGTGLEEPAEIELVCETSAQPQGKTDSSGRFSLQLGDNRFVGASDASVRSNAAGAGFGGALSGQSQVDGASVMALMGCFLRARLKGYRSEAVDLSRIRVGDDPDVGAIILHPVAEVQGLTVSATSMNAPRNAQRQRQNALNSIEQERFEDAEQQLRRAVEFYPDYAEAWYDLGTVLQVTNRQEEAREAYLNSIACDPRLVQPHLSLARMSAVEQDWEAARDSSEEVLRLNPYEFPQAYYFNAVAHYNLRNYALALDSAQQAVEIDAANAVPLARQLLGVLYSRMGNHEAAAEQYRSYIERAPAGANLDAVKNLLAEAERLAAQRNQE